MDVHKDSITIATADDGRDGEVRVYGKIAHDLNQTDKVMRKLVSQNNGPRCVYEAGLCGYLLRRHLNNKGASKLACGHEDAAAGQANRLYRISGRLVNMDARILRVRCQMMTAP